MDLSSVYRSYISMVLDGACMAWHGQTPLHLWTFLPLYKFVWRQRTLLPARHCWFHILPAPGDCAATARCGIAATAVATYSAAMVQRDRNAPRRRARGGWRGGTTRWRFDGDKVPARRMTPAWRTITYAALAHCGGIPIVTLYCLRLPQYRASLPRCRSYARCTGNFLPLPCDAKELHSAGAAALRRI